MNAQRLGQVLLVVATLVVACTVVAAVIVMGTPAQQRAQRLDQRRTEQLERIVTTARSYAQAKGRLAPDLITLAGKPGLRLALTDPESGVPYDYAVTGAESFKVCANFATDTAADDGAPGAGVWRERWLHGAGHQCFDRKWKRGARDDEDASAYASDDP